MDRQIARFWIKDVTDHLCQAYDQWQDAEGSAAGYLADSMQRDVDELRRLFRSIGLHTERQQRVPA